MKNYGLLSISIMNKSKAKSLRKRKSYRIGKERVRKKSILKK